MATLLYLSSGNPILNALTDDKDSNKYIKINIKRPSGDKQLLLPRHPTLPEVTVVAVTKSIYNDTDQQTRNLRAPHALHTILEYYDHYNLPEASEYALARHLNSEDPQVAAASILYLAKHHKQFKMATYLHHMRSAAAYHDCPFMFLATYGNNSQSRAGQTARLAHHFRQIASIKEAHRPYKPENRVPPQYDTYMIPLNGTQKDTSTHVYLEPTEKFFTCQHCGTRLKDTYAVRLTHPNKCPSQAKPTFPTKRS